MKRTPFLVAVLVLWGAVAGAATPVPFTPQEFDRLAHDGQPVVVYVFASWCPTCKAQKPIIASLAVRPAYREVAILTVDFDTDQAVLKRFGVTMQSTLIAFRGGKETGRSVGDSSASGIESLFRKARGP
jgi:thioredoxin-like negative regulator of GroEL